MKAILHIGSPKTGTSTIQIFLERNRQSLKKQGIVIPSGVYYAEHNAYFAVHHKLAAATYLPEVRGKCPQFLSYAGLEEDFPSFENGLTPEDQDKLWENYRREIETNCRKDDLVIFSDEMQFFFHENEVIRVKELLDSLFDDVTIILYLRRQPELLVSLYNTYCQVGIPWNIFNLLRCTPELNYDQVVKRWSIFGKDKLKIRLFDKQEFHNNDLLSDFSHTIGFDLTGLECVENKNETLLTSVEIEFLRLLNSHIPNLPGPYTLNSSRHQLMQFFLSYRQKNCEKKKKAYHLNRNEVQRILDQFREGNDWIAREYLGREKLFDDDVSMYPEEVDSPHGLTLEKCAEITAHLWKEQCNAIRQLLSEKDACVTEIQLLKRMNSIYWHYYRCKILSKLTFGKKRKHYKVKRDMFHELIRQIRSLYKLQQQ